MRDRYDGVIRMLGAKYGLRRNGWRLFVLLTTMIGIACAIVFETWIILLPAILLPYAEARWHERPQPSMDTADIFQGLLGADRALAPNPAAVPNVGSIKNHRTQMPHVVDRILRHHTRLTAARLAKASMLWYFNGDAEGARCHCREILGRIQREDPLFEKVCDLYLQTYASPPPRRMPPARDIAVDAGRPDWPAAPDLKKAKIIPLSSKRPTSSAPQ